MSVYGHSRKNSEMCVWSHASAKTRESDHTKPHENNQVWLLRLTSLAIQWKSHTRSVQCQPANRRTSDSGWLPNATISNVSEWCSFVIWSLPRVCLYGLRTASRPSVLCFDLVCLPRFRDRRRYTPWVKKTRHLTLAHNFTKYLSIFKILSLLDSLGNL